MSFQEQLAQCQKPTACIPVFEVDFEVGPLGNQQASQVPSIMKAAGRFSPVGLNVVANYGGVVVNTVVPVSGNYFGVPVSSKYGGIVVNAEFPASGHFFGAPINYGGIVVNAELLAGGNAIGALGSSAGVVVNAEMPAIVANAESTEMGWLVRNAEELGRHKGEWLLIQGEQMLVHSHDFAAVRAEVRERQINSPFVYYVPTDDESNSVTI